MTDKPIAADEFPVVAIKLDREGNVEYASPQIHSLMGIPPDQAVGKKFFDFFHIEESQTFEAILKNVHHDNSAYFEHTFQTPKGERYFCWQPTKPKRLTGLKPILLRIQVMNSGLR